MRGGWDFFQGIKRARNGARDSSLLPITREVQ